MGSPHSLRRKALPAPDPGPAASRTARGLRRPSRPGCGWGTRTLRQSRAWLWHFQTSDQWSPCPRSPVPPELPPRAWTAVPPFSRLVPFLPGASSAAGLPGGGCWPCLHRRKPRPFPPLGPWAWGSRPAARPPFLGPGPVVSLLQTRNSSPAAGHGAAWPRLAAHAPPLAASSFDSGSSVSWSDQMCQSLSFWFVLFNKILA